MGSDKAGTWWRTAAGAAGAVLLLAGCTAQAQDRSGGDTVVLHLATIDGEINPSGQLVGPAAFVQELSDVSGDRLRVEVATSYGDGKADAETRLVQAIAAGDLDGGWPATRAFAQAGIHGLEAVEAPLLLANTAAVADLVTGPAAGDTLRLLDGTGVRGMALAAGPLRRPFAAHAPLLDPQDWAGQPFRVFNSPVQTDTVTALGGTPVNVGLDWVDHVRAGDLRGAEFDIAQYASVGAGTAAGAVTANVVLWPKVFVFALSQKRFDSLTEQQQRWVLQAAEKARQASVDGAPADSARARELCDGGVRFIAATDAQLSALHAAVAPVIERLAADPATASLLTRVQDIARRHPEAEVVDVPAGCRTPTDSPPDPTTPSGISTLPDGVYRVELPASAVAEAGVDNGPGWSGTWTLEVTGGEYVVTCRPLTAPGHDCGNEDYDGPLEAGVLRGTGDTVTFDYSAQKLSALTGCTLPPSQIRPGACGSVEPYSVTWALDGDRLDFEAVDGGNPVNLTLEPFRKIA